MGPPRRWREGPRTTLRGHPPGTPVRRVDPIRHTKRVAHIGPGHPEDLEVVVPEPGLAVDITAVTKGAAVVLAVVLADHAGCGVRTGRDTPAGSRRGRTRGCSPEVGVGRRRAARSDEAVTPAVSGSPRPPAGGPHGPVARRSRPGAARRTRASAAGTPVSRPPSCPRRRRLPGRRVRSASRRRWPAGRSCMGRPL